MTARRARQHAGPPSSRPTSARPCTGFARGRGRRRRLGHPFADPPRRRPRGRIAGRATHGLRSTAHTATAIAGTGLDTPLHPPADQPVVRLPGSTLPRRGGSRPGLARRRSASAATVADPGNGGGHVSIMNSMARAFADSPAAAALPPPPPRPHRPAVARRRPGAAAPRDLRLRPLLDAAPSASGFDVNGLTTLAYFSVDVNADGTPRPDRRRAGTATRARRWPTSSPGPTPPVDRVVLTVTVLRPGRPSTPSPLTPPPARALAALWSSSSRPRTSTGSTSTSRARASADQAGPHHARRPRCRRACTPPTRTGR